MLINEAINEIMKIENTESQKEISKILGVSQGTVSNYMMQKLYPSLRAASKVYDKYGFQVEPYTEQALEAEAKWRKKYDPIPTSD